MFSISLITTAVPLQGDRENTVFTINSLWGLYLVNTEKGASHLATEKKDNIDMN